MLLAAGREVVKTPAYNITKLSYRVQTHFFHWISPLGVKYYTVDGAKVLYTVHFVRFKIARDIAPATS